MDESELCDFQMLQAAMLLGGELLEPRLQQL
eukprot:CAMPEP_0175810464 /NCGR_PEP_ID=MMETSP0107_2-20121207/3337_1 /TAXON_ID=195067 ORGANISM="Goniomonas pacifica, Strain CCMP1869" /NCGR_SAMPLE_ID=MMETSP0107_2 /ASSEMBLY_ACC=CAM_ASM_000203 /LENGTH=30 /DNA_ID= /DNA_START= /DNA_END= /DNA_ORIENTATION=